MKIWLVKRFSTSSETQTSKIFPFNLQRLSSTTNSLIFCSKSREEDFVLNIRKLRGIYYDSAKSSNNPRVFLQFSSDKKLDCFFGSSSSTHLFSSPEGNALTKLISQTKFVFKTVYSSAKKFPLQTSLTVRSC